MFPSALELKERMFAAETHPYIVLEHEIAQRLGAEATLLDAGCGRHAPVLAKFRDRASRLVGIDLVAADAVPGIEILRGDMGTVPLPDGSVDIAYARSVMEHVDDPEGALREMARVLKPGGTFLVLTPNLWDYASIVALLTPNRWHPWIVRRTEGRSEEDVFPTRYRANTRRALARHAARAGLDLVDFRYLGQYPAYFLFSGLLFMLAAGYEKLIRRHPLLYPLKGWIFAVLEKPAPARRRDD